MNLNFCESNLTLNLTFHDAAEMRNNFFSFSFTPGLSLAKNDNTHT